MTRYVVEVRKADDKATYIGPMGCLVTSTEMANWHVAYSAALDIRDAFNQGVLAATIGDRIAPVYAEVRSISISVVLS